MKNPLMKFAKQDLKIAKTRGSVMVCQCKVFGDKTNVTISRDLNGLFSILWANVDNGVLKKGEWLGCTEEVVLNFLVDAYDVQEVA